jgi:hypothetical protein
MQLLRLIQVVVGKRRCSSPRGGGFWEEWLDGARDFSGGQRRSSRWSGDPTLAQPHLSLWDEKGRKMRLDERVVAQEEGGGHLCGGTTT